MSAAYRAATPATAGQTAGQGAPTGPRRLPGAGAWEGARGKEPLHWPRWARSGCERGLGPPPPATRSANSVPGGQQRREPGAPRRNVESGPGRGPRRRLEPLGARHPAPQSPGVLGPRWSQPHLRGGWSRGRALRRRGARPPGAAARGRVLPRAFPGAGHLLSVPQGAGRSPPSAASWLRLRRWREFPEPPLPPL